MKFDNGTYQQLLSASDGIQWAAVVASTCLKHRISAERFTSEALNKNRKSVSITGLFIFDE